MLISERKIQLEKEKHGRWLLTMLGTDRVVFVVQDELLIMISHFVPNEFLLPFSIIYRWKPVENF